MRILTLWLFEIAECYLTVSNHALENAECWDFEASNLWWCKHSTEPKEKFLVNEFDESIYSQSCQLQPPWHLDRITQEDHLDFSKPYPYTNYVVKPVVYVLDTYVQVDHPDFEGRVKFGYSTTPGNSNPHGTHVMGLILSKSFGVCKHCNGVSVRVLGDNGSGYFSDLIKGLSWVSHNAPKSTVSVINISISGKGSDSLDLAIEALHRQGLIVVVAAGNDGRLASEYSPARSIHAISVGSTNLNDEMSLFSNFGKALDILAPGEYIQSTIPQSRNGWMSGTSMASPIVSGAMALVVCRNPFVRDVWILKKFILNDTVKKWVKKVRVGTPNLLVNTRDNDRCNYNKFIFQ